VGALAIAVGTEGLITTNSEASNATSRKKVALLVVIGLLEFRIPGSSFTHE
jgi:hypothetical protein